MRDFLLITQQGLDKNNRKYSKAHRWRQEVRHIERTHHSRSDTRKRLVCIAIGAIIVACFCLMQTACQSANHESSHPQKRSSGILSNLESDPTPRLGQQAGSPAKGSPDPTPKPRESGAASVGSNTQLSSSQLSHETSSEFSSGRDTVEASGENFEITSIRPRNDGATREITPEISEYDTSEFDEELVYRSEDLTNGGGIGFLVWVGKLRKGESLTIEDGRASIGALKGKLPGIPVALELDEEDFEILEAPSSGNGWKRLRIKSVNTDCDEIIIPWLARE
jgi:hypothetical protein